MAVAIEMAGMRFGVSILVLSLTAAGATLEKLSIEEMTAKSTAIVRVKAISSSPGHIGSTIYTQTRFQVLERWKGPETAEVVVSEPGGTVDGVTQKFTGVPRFTSGQEVVLFLWTGPSGRTQVIGFSQGVFQVQKSSAGEEEVVREQSGEMMLAPGTWEPVRDDGIRMSLRHLALQVRGVLERGREGR